MWKNTETVKKSSLEKNKDVKITDNENSASSAKVCGWSLRNLPKCDLAGVIFGCKHNTIEECFREKLFGLPYPHYPYVRNVEPGLPLFLFNYNDRTLHGVFEAVTGGQLDINKYGWMEDGTGCATTPYPAQARFRVRKLYHPLAEDVFMSTISKNYYEPRLFWFELDRSQTDQLISLFSLFPITSLDPLSKHMQKLYALLKGSGSSCVMGRKEGAEASNGHPANFESGLSWNYQDQSLKVQQKVDDMGVPDEGKNKQESVWVDTSFGCSYSSVVKNATLPDEGKNKQESVWLDTSFGRSYSSVVKNAVLPEIQCNQPTVHGIAWIDHVDKNINTYGDNPVADEKHPDDPRLPEQSEPSESDASKTATEDHSINSDEVPDDWETLVEQDRNGPSEETVLGESTHLDPGLESTDMNLAQPLPTSTHVYPLLLKLQQEVDELKVCKVEQDQKIHFLEQELVMATSEIQKLKFEQKLVESSSLSLLRRLKAEECDTSKWSIFVAGGFDGSSWLSDLERYSPSMDIVRSVCPLSSARSKYGAAKLNGEVYVIGGSVENVWCDTVESYNPVTERWTNRHALTKRKGGLAAVSFGDMIVILGGGNEVECLSEVEIFDPQAGRWIISTPMLQKRFVPCASQINGVLYVVGGYNGTNYLSSLERYDPRESSWVELQSMKTKRGCHALVVLNDKLYAFGGYDGQRMVSSVEVFDPRINSWFTGEPMHLSRGYFGSAVVGESIYAIGGVNDIEVLNTVEIYKEGYGWQMTNLKGVGKRGFFSAVVM